MGLLFSEGFDSYGSIADIQRVLDWSDAAYALNPTGGPFGTQSMEIGGSATFPYRQRLQITPLSETASFGISFWGKFPIGVSSNTREIFMLQSVTDQGTYPNTSSGMFVLGSNFTTGTLYVPITNGTTTILETAPVLERYQWHNIQIEFRLGDSPNGGIRIWVDGALVGEDWGRDTYQSAFPNDGGDLPTAVVFGTETSSLSSNFEIDDVIIWDDQDYGRDNDLTTFTGVPMVIETKRPNGAGTYTQLTSSSGGANYTDVDEVAVSSTDYVYGSTEGAADSYAFEALSTNVGTIIGVGQTAMARHTGYVRQTVTGFCVSSGSSSEDFNQIVVRRSTGDLNTRQQSFFTADPATTSAWTTGGFDAAEFGFKLTTST